MNDLPVSAPDFSRSLWIWPDYRLYDLRNTYAHFRKDFFLHSVPSSVWFHLTADQNYRLWVNGAPVCRGPARGYQVNWPYDSVDLASFLTKGANWIAVEAYNGGVSTFGYLTQSSAGFLCAGNAGEVSLASDATWLTRLDRSRRKDTAPYSYQLPFQEHVDGRIGDRTWIYNSQAPELAPEGIVVEDPLALWHRPGDQCMFGAMPWHAVEPRGIP